MVGHPPPLLLIFAHDINVRRWSTLASLVVLLYEYISTFTDEVYYIWRRPFTVIRATYLLARYITIAMQTTNLYLVFGPLSSLNISRSTCMEWFASQMAVACLLMAALDCILMLRVYALHSKNWKMGGLLSAIFTGQIALHAVLGPKSFDEVPFDAICNNTEPPRTVLYFGIFVCAKYILLAILGALKYDLMRLGAPVVNLAMGDGAFATAVVCGMWGILVPYCLLGHLSQSHVVFGWPSTVMSICCCRLIMNLQALPLESLEHDPESYMPDLTVLMYDLRPGDTISRATEGSRS